MVISALTSGKFYRLPPDKENPDEEHIFMHRGG